MLPLVLLLLGLHSSPGEPPSRAPEWLSGGRRATTSLPGEWSEEQLLLRTSPAGADHGAGGVAGWVSGLPVQIDVRDGGICIALKLHNS